MNNLPDIEKARFNMVEQQIRPWEVLDQAVLDSLFVVKREDFVPAAWRNLAFADLEIPLPCGENMLAPRIEARVLQELAVGADDTVLEIGAGSGYMAALLAHRAQSVVTVDIHPELQAMAATNLRNAGFGGVRVEAGDGSAGWGKELYDVIVVSGSLPSVPESLLAQLKPGGRLAVFVGTAPVMSAELITRAGERSFDTVKLFETIVKPLHLKHEPSRFKF
jgi:protein-L-isoaspartate(D-aspartate) O-methyltransferase